MKILFFANTDSYLSTLRLDLAKALQEQGHEVVMVSPAGECVSSLQEAGFRWLEQPLSRRGINPFAELGYLRQVEALYRAEKPDLVHHFTIKPILYGSYAARKLGIRAVVNTITGLGFVFLNPQLNAVLLRPLVKRFYRRALQGSQVIFESPDCMSFFTEHNLVKAEQSQLIVGTGVDTRVFVPLSEPENIPLVALPGRMLFDRGITDFIDAAVLLRDSGVRARFALVGANEPRHPSGIPLQQLGTWQKEGIVEWWGWQEDISAVFALADIICLPSYREGVPRVLIEAAASGRPIVTSDLPGCRQVVVDGENGLLVPPHSTTALAAALRRLIENRELCSAMGRRGRERALAVFSNERILEQTLEAYRLAQL